jgi:hypothetical protein
LQRLARNELLGNWPGAVLPHAIILWNIVALHLEANDQTYPILIRLQLQEAAEASSGSSERLFELNLGGEAVTIAPDRQNRQLAAAMPVSHGAVLRLESAVYVDPIPLAGVADIVEQQVVLLGSGRLHTRLDTPPLINRRHPDSCLAPFGGLCGRRAVVRQGLLRCAP